MQTVWHETGLPCWLLSTTGDAVFVLPSVKSTISTLRKHNLSADELIIYLQNCLELDI